MQTENRQQQQRQDVVMFDHHTTTARTTQREEIRTYQVTKYGDIIATQRNKGIAKGQRAKRIFISKTSFYLSNELTASELQAVEEWEHELVSNPEKLTQAEKFVNFYIVIYQVNRIIFHQPMN